MTRPWFLKPPKTIWKVFSVFCLDLQSGSISTSTKWLAGNPKGLIETKIRFDYCENDQKFPRPLWHPNCRPFRTTSLHLFTAPLPTCSPSVLAPATAGTSWEAKQLLARMPGAMPWVFQQKIPRMKRTLKSLDIVVWVNIVVAYIYIYKYICKCIHIGIYSRILLDIHEDWNHDV